ncbi:hypothetical protein F5X96DRAFT_547548 [Biscogniauxia mediterranea]|nr:hypothetical protein F5X96DRAFT_547548 [Biscogniauxia mediterranea]
MAPSFHYIHPSPVILPCLIALSVSSSASFTIRNPSSSSFSQTSSIISDLTSYLPSFFSPITTLHHIHHLRPHLSLPSLFSPITTLHYILSQTSSLSPITLFSHHHSPLHPVSHVTTSHPSPHSTAHSSPALGFTISPLVV